MSKVKFKLNRKGVRELMQGPEMQAVLQDYASQVAQRAGSGYANDTYVGKTRANCKVYPVTAEALEDCYRNNTLLKAVGSK